MNVRHSIVFLTYNKQELIDRRLDEVDRHLIHRDDFEIIAFDNGSENHGVRLALISRSQISKLPLVIHRSDKNLGFGPGFNRAVSYAEGEIVHLISDDVTIYGDFLEVMGEFGPREVICHHEVRHKAGWNQFGDFHFPYPNGYYLALYKRSWDILGGFDERFQPHDYEDVDLGMRIFKSDDFSLIERDDLPIRHLPASTIGYGPERFDRTCAMRAIFAEKWELPNEPERP